MPNNLIKSFHRLHLALVYPLYSYGMKNCWATIKGYNFAGVPLIGDALFYCPQIEKKGVLSVEK